MALKKIVKMKTVYVRIDSLEIKSKEPSRIQVGIYTIDGIGNETPEAYSFDQVTEYYVQRYWQEDDSSCGPIEKDFVWTFNDDELSKEGNSPYRVAYAWLKKNVLLFNDFVDC